MSTTAQPTETVKLSRKQLTRLDELASLRDPPRVIGWDIARRGPIVQFVTGSVCVVTRDGGMDRR